ncbi:MAG: DUF4129 domain-containing protein [Gloeomargarita sp. SKYB31]|nr:DUF4129 domain-containing protein [Gloeomargarita sp. SKYB31]
MARFGTMQASHQQTNWTWQIQLWQQQFQEWWEWTLQQLGKQLPNLDGINVPPLYLQILLWLLLGVVGIWLGSRLIQALRGYRWRWWPWPARRLLSSPHVSRAASSWLETAHAYREQGNYTEAVRCLYFSLLEYLDQRWGIRPLASRTDGEYRRLTQHLWPQESYDRLWQAHERICFNQDTISAAQWQIYWQAYQRVVNE